MFLYGLRSCRLYRLCSPCTESDPDCFIGSMFLSYRICRLCLSCVFLYRLWSCRLYIGCLSLQTLILRDWWLCTVLSIMFEILEYTLEHQLPNFSECWWDHVSNIIFIFYGISVKYVYLPLCINVFAHFKWWKVYISSKSCSPCFLVVYILRFNSVFLVIYLRVNFWEKKIIIQTFSAQLLIVFNILILNIIR